MAVLINGKPPTSQQQEDFKQAFGIGGQFTPEEVALLRALIEPEPVLAPTITTLPVLNPAVVGQPVTWSNGIATGAVSINYSLRNASGGELTNASGIYTPTVAGGILTVYMTAVGDDGQTTEGQSNAVTVTSSSVGSGNFTNQRAGNGNIIFA